MCSHALICHLNTPSLKCIFISFTLCFSVKGERFIHFEEKPEYFYPFSNWIYLAFILYIYFFILYCWVLRDHHVFLIWVLFQMRGFQIPPHTHGLSFHSLSMVFTKLKFLIFAKYNLKCFLWILFYGSWFWCEAESCSSCSGFAGFYPIFSQIFCSFILHLNLWSIF